MSAVLYWVLVAYFTLSITLTIAIIGQPRKPIGRDTAVVQLIVSGVFITALTLWGGVWG